MNIVRLLINRSCEINMLDDEEGLSAFLMAIKEGDYEMIELLMDANCSTHQLTRDGQTPLNLYLECNTQDRI